MHSIKLIKYILFISLFICSCNNSNSNLINKLQSGNPGKIVSAYNNIIEQGPDSIDTLYNLDDYNFCLIGMNIINDFGTAALPVLYSRLKNETNYRMKLLLLCSIGAIGDNNEDVIEIVNDEFQSEDIITKVLICKIIESIKPPSDDVKDILLFSLNSEYSELIVGAAFAIASLNVKPDQEYISKLIELWTKQGNIQEKIALACALYKQYYNQNEMLDFIRETGQTETVYIPYILKAIRIMDSVESYNLLNEILINRSNIHRIMVISNLYRVEPNDITMNILVDSLLDSNYQVVLGSLDSLWFFGDRAKAAYKDIIEFKNNSDHQLTPGIPEITKDVIFWFDQDKTYVYQDWSDYKVILNMTSLLSKIN